MPETHHIPPIHPVMAANGNASTPAGQPHDNPRLNTAAACQGYEERPDSVDPRIPPRRLSSIAANEATTAKIAGPAAHT
jgi:hypothetical protein